MVKCRNGYSFWWFFFLHSFVQGLAQRYPELYEEPSGDISQHQINFGRKWGEYSSVAQLSGEEFLNINKVIKKPLEECLMFLAYLSDKQLTEKLLHNESMMKFKHR